MIAQHIGTFFYNLIKSHLVEQVCVGDECLPQVDNPGGLVPQGPDLQGHEAEVELVQGEVLKKIDSTFFFCLIEENERKILLL